jgi:hypothetical protein
VRPRADPRIKLVVDEALSSDIVRAATALDIVQEAAARAEKAVRTKTRKANAKKRPRRRNDAPRGIALRHVIAEALRSDPKAGATAKDIASTAKIRLSTVYTYLKAIGAYSNGKGRWWFDKKTYLANFPIAGKKKKAANGAATSP